MNIPHLLTKSLLLILLLMPAFSQSLSDAQIKERIIQESIANYSGNCPCPYNSARNGSRCGKRSAYNKPGGYSPKCYASDISTQEVNAWRKRHSAR
ncbi:MAG TPA: hypothetical protein H9889_10145 [Candidatus Ignatzschineria merdigallinarum]|uniref:Uncharacterized protein n=1 Tax=Candidatus Ignatzschineria merdigallinarum TaxID=2838621 RepID=A0A9D1TVB4_9GAMM|nr:hypothetical protein [Candidatus Ignatzschineria merdigallinarum]